MADDDRRRGQHDVIIETWEGGRLDGKVVSRTERCHDKQCDASVTHTRFEGDKR